MLTTLLPCHKKYPKIARNGLLRYAMSIKAPKSPNLLVYTEVNVLRMQGYQAMIKNDIYARQNGRLLEPPPPGCS